MVKKRTSFKYYNFSNDYILAKECRKCVAGFIEDIWNNNRLELLPAYLHPAFRDSALPKGLQNAACLFAYLQELRRNIAHQTIIERLIYEQDFVVVKVKMILSSLDNPLNKVCQYQRDETLTGYRILAMCDQRIIGHWEFLDRI